MRIKGKLGDALRLFLILVPLFPPLAPLSVLWLPWVGRLPPWGWFFLGVYGLGLFFPAMLTGDPWAPFMALARFTFAAGLLGLGVALGREEGLRPLGYGILGVYLVALVFSYALDGVSLWQRLAHPFYTPVALAFWGGIGVLLAFYLRYPWPLRVLLGGLGALVLLLSGGRSGMLAFLLGALAGGIFYRRVLLAIGLVGLLLLLGLHLGFRPVQRLLEGGLSGREGLWLAAYEAMKGVEWTGLGPYLFGEHFFQIIFAYEGCFIRLIPIFLKQEVPCPPWDARLAGLLIFPHNQLLQALGESGVLGALGFLLLMGGFAAAAWGRPLLLSLLWAFWGMGLVDNPTEIYFFLGGVALAQSPLALPRALVRAGLWGTLLLFFWASPFLYMASRPLPPPPEPLYLVLPQEGQGFLRLRDGEGYRVQVWLCQERCQRLGWEWRGEETVAFPWPENLAPGRYRLRVLLFKEEFLALRPAYTWEREVER